MYNFINILSGNLHMLSGYINLSPFKCIFCRKIFLVSGKEFLPNNITTQPSFLIASNYSSSKLKHDYSENLAPKNINNHEPSETDPNSINSYKNQLSNKNISKSFSLPSQNLSKDSLLSNKPFETIVNKYSRVPSLPSSVPDKLLISIPEKPSKEEVPSLIHRFFLGRFVKYLKKFRESLETEMPDTFHMFNTFMNGFKEFVTDFR